MAQASDMKIGIIIGTTRDTRFGEKAARWLYDIAQARGDMQFELLDVRDFDLPFFNEAASNAWVPSKSPQAIRWQQKVGECDGYIAVTAEYNHGIPASLKNALDQAYVEWNRKPLACVGYGGVGAARAIEHLRMVAVELQMAPTRTGVHIAGADFYALLQGQKSLADLAYLQPGVNTMLDELAWWTRALKTARASSAREAA